MTELKFIYKDLVEVFDGFYKGQKGRVIDVSYVLYHLDGGTSGARYLVKTTEDSFWVSSNELRKCEDN